MALNPKQEQFCQRYLLHGNATRAYREAFDGALGAAGSSFRLMQKDYIKKRIAELIGEDCEEIQIERRYLIQHHLNVLETPVGEIDENHPLAQEYKVTKGSMSVKMPNKADSAKELARLIGAYEPEKLEISGEEELIALVAGIGKANSQEHDPA